MDATTAWVKPPTKGGGVDHLGIQQTPIFIFSNLLPGMTVLTDRISNYSFYPWVAWTHHQEGQRLGLDFVHTLRRADCLLTLVAERHAQTRQEDVKLHGRGLVGRNTLVPALRPDAKRPIPLGELAAPRSENSNSYFKNRLGGLGQYYLGPLRELGVLRREGTKVECSEDIGVPLAKAFDGRVDRKAFLGVLRQGVVDDKDLDRLASFCPCYLSTHVLERELLIDLLFARKANATARDQQRRQTLLLLLDLALRRDDHGEASLDEAFRAACLTSAIDDESAWNPPQAWNRVRRAWAVYERNDELSIAVLGVFWVALRLVDDRGGTAQSVGEIGKLVAEAASKALKKEGKLKVYESVAARARSLPPLPEWKNAEHEFQRSRDVWSAARDSDDTACLVASIDTLLALAARHTEPHPYLEAGIPSDYLSHYPLNLSSFGQNISGEWRALTVAEWAGTLAAEWGVEAHLRVALRKLHAESLDTFLLYVTDEGIRRRADAEPPRPGFTASRVSRAVQFLVDLGLARWQTPEDPMEEQGTPSGGWVARISPLGRELREDLGA